MKRWVTNATVMRLGLPALVPPVAVLLLALFGRSAASDTGAGATITPADAPVLSVQIQVAARSRPSPEVESRATERTLTLTRSFEMASPFWETRPGAGQSTESTPKNAHGFHDLQLSSLMDAPGGAVAVINGRPYRVGDQVEGLGVIESIEVPMRTTTIKLETGGNVVLSLAGPSDSTP